MRLAQRRCHAVGTLDPYPKTKNLYPDYIGGVPGRKQAS